MPGLEFSILSHEFISLFCGMAYNSNFLQADFQKAADLGSPFAKMQVVALNPYAAMCNKMLSEVFNNLKQGKPEE